MSTRACKKRKLNRSGPNTRHSPVFPRDATAAATDEDRKNWNGWCEIESEPALFNAMLERLGVKGVKVIEPDMALDAGIFLELHRPVYGLIFLFRWKEDDAAERESHSEDEIWFANQTVNNACASVALLNIINNIPELELGEPLQQFKSFTSNFSPALRGDAVGNFQFLKEVHNSFARKMDMLTSDLALKYDATETKSKKKKSSRQQDSESAFHFIAFVPIGNQIWKLDGLERGPCNIGLIEADDWLEQVKPELASRMGGGTESAVFGLVKDPLPQLIKSHAQKKGEIDAILARLDILDRDWRSFTVAYGNLENRLAEYMGIRASPSSDRMLNDMKLCPMLEQTLSTDCLERLFGLLQELLSAHCQIGEQVAREQESNKADKETIAARARDFGPAIRLWLKFHARKGLVKDLVDASRITD